MPEKLAEHAIPVPTKKWGIGPPVSLGYNAYADIPNTKGTTYIDVWSRIMDICFEVVSWIVLVVQWLGVGLVIERLLV